MAKILIVDDDDAFRKVLRMLLTRMGHEVTEANDGRTAWSTFQAHPAELVIMDLIMPEKEGLETIQQFRRHKAPAKILAISGGGRVDARDILRVAEQFGADKVLAKPFSSDDLSLALKELLPAQPAGS